MSEIENPSAFPNPVDPVRTGMTLRDWFAGQALSGILANATISPDATDKTIAVGAYAAADAMLAARGENPHD